jgi:hypothetical protein
MAAPETTDRPVLPATRARQGRWGRHVFWVLLISTILAALALFAAWMFRADDLASTEPKSNGAVAAQHSFDAPEPADVTR